MKITLLCCAILTFCSQHTPAQSFLTTNFSNNFSAISCSTSQDWAKCACNISSGTGGSWPYNHSVPLEWQNGAGDNQIFGMSGTVVSTTVAGSDFPFSHVFGYDPTHPGSSTFNDWESYIALDPQYLSLLSKGNNPHCCWFDGTHCCEFDGIIKDNAGQFKNTTIENGIMGLELEDGLIPDLYKSLQGDRTVIFGTLIGDCSHDEDGYHSEIHPPLMLVSARAMTNGNLVSNQQRLTPVTSAVTLATIISQPFHINQHYNGGKTFLDASAGEFAKALASAEGWGWLTLWIAPTYQLQIIADLDDKPFRGNQTMSFDVYPQFQQSTSDYSLWHQFHFTIRSGVNVAVTKMSDHISVTVTMNEAAYQPAVNLLKQHTRTIGKGTFDDQAEGDIWGWISATADIFPGLGATFGQGIQSVKFESTQATSDNDQRIFPLPDHPDVTFDLSNDQPYPIYGWMTVGWRKNGTVAGACSLRPSPLAFSVDQVNFFNGSLAKSQLVTITNPTAAPIQLGKLSLEGGSSSYFLLQYHDILRVLPGSPQPPEDCSNRVLQPGGSCSFRVAMLPNNSGNNANDLIDVPGAGPCPLKIRVRQLNPEGN